MLPLLAAFFVVFATAVFLVVVFAAADFLVGVPGVRGSFVLRCGLIGALSRREDRNRE